MQSKSSFIAEFEPIRGIAAFTVALMHSFYVLDVARVAEPGQSVIELGRILFNGFAAVTVFFILSGVVLGMALDRYAGTLEQRWSQFIILRILRIYPMVIVVTVVICGYLLLSPPSNEHLAASSWFNRNYHEPLGWVRIMQNLLLINVSLNPVAWTLLVEMAMAAILPLLHIAARLRRPRVDLLMLASLIALALLADDLRSLWTSNPAYVLFCEILLPHAYKFYLGLLLPTYTTARTVRAAMTHPALYYCAVLSVLVLARTAAAQVTSEGQAGVLIESLAAAALLIPFCSPRNSTQTQSVLLSRPIRWLGQVSYSFYLWHFIVLYAMSSWLLRQIPPEMLLTHAIAFSCALAVCSVAITCLLSELTYRQVEVRCMGYGRRLVRSFGAKSRLQTQRGDLVG